MTSPRTLPSSLLALAIVVGACTGGQGASPGSSQPQSSPAGSPAADACPAAPEVSQADAEAWIAEGRSATVLPVIASSLQVCGQNRILIGLLDGQNRSIATPDRTLEVAFFDLGRDPDQPAATAEGEFVWAIEGSRGLYVVNVDLGESGIWGAEVRTAAGGAEEVARAGFQVHPTGVTKRVGEAAPASKTPTADDVGGDLAKLSSDEDPEPRFYETSVDEALAAHEPFVLVFATPKFCTSAVCGPTLEKVKPFVDEFPSVTFINVEPYQLAWDGSQLKPVLTDDQLTPVPSVDEWGLLTEPWLFVVNESGTIRGSFEGTVGESELRAALEAVS
ncbi:MAG: hypothetical protein FIA92_09140 [Chloroflexi bacterium]|nr:hypothetical protein [Chloroflexota bacterium]